MFTDKRMIKSTLVYSYNRINYTAVKMKMNELQLQAIPWMNLRNSIEQKKTN